MSDVLKVAERMISALNRDLEPDGRLGLVRDYLRGDHRQPYAPKGARREFRETGQNAVTNWLPLVSDTYADSLHVAGYRAKTATDNVDVWEFWQANGLDARQTIATRGALEYGAAYVRVLRSVGKSPSITPLRALRSYALFEDVDDEYPAFFLYRRGHTALGDEEIYELLDDTNLYEIRVSKDGGSQLRIASTSAHGMPVCPIVRFRDRLDGEAVGIIRPLIRLQDRINEVVFNLLMALQYASLRQRWATGLALPEKDILDPETGEVIGSEPIEPFEAAVNRLWISDSPDTKFGDFAQTEVSGHLQTYDSSVRTFAAHAQISPNILTGDLINLSADALAQMEKTTQRRLGGYEMLFGEAWEQVFQLASIAAGLPIVEGAEVRWRDTEARSFESTVKGLSTLATDLKAPVTELWERVPGVTPAELARWKAAAEKPDAAALLTEALTRNAESTVAAAPAGFSPAPPPPPTL